MTQAGFEEIAHTADWSIRVWAPDLPGLFAQSARGMNTLAGATLADAPRELRSVESRASDPETMLVEFLSELVYYAEQENLAFDHFDINFSNGLMHAEMHGAPLKSLNKAIKAVTFHNLTIQTTERGLEAVIVFDV